MEEKIDSDCTKIEKEFKKNLPQISHFFSHERYDEDMTDIGEDEEFQDSSVVYYRLNDDENSSIKKLEKRSHDEDTYDFMEDLRKGHDNGNDRNLRFESLEIEDDDGIMRDYVNFKRKKRYGI